MNVNVNTKEIYIEFDQPMSMNAICLSSNCDYGICYKNAYWITERKLVVKIHPRLLPNHDYKIYIGNDRGCNLRSEMGVSFPKTLWNFRTGDIR